MKCSRIVRLFSLNLGFNFYANIFKRGDVDCLVMTDMLYTKFTYSPYFVCI